MADEVEITNVGGENGVASEATLASLTRAIEKLAGASGKDPKKEAGKVQALHTRTLLEDIKAIEDAIDAEKAKTKAVKKATEAVNRMSKAALGAAVGLLGSLTGSVLNLSSALVAGGDELSDFAQHIPLIGGLITPFTQMLDNSVSTFRDLSSVGAGFNNSITEMRMTAASLELNLDEMAGMVRSNSENLRFLGGTVTEGVKRFAAINKAIKNTGDFAFFKNLGFTIEEINEGMLSYIGLQAGLGRLQRMDNMTLQKSTASYLEDLDQLAKLTGKQRDEIAASMVQEMNDARVRAMVARMSTTQQENFNANLALISNTIPGMTDSFKNLAAGLPVDEISQALRSIGGDAGNAMADLFSNAEDIDPTEFQRRFTALAPQVADHLATAFNPAQVAAMMSGAGGEIIAPLLALGGDLQKAGSMDVDAMLAQQAATDNTTQTLTTFDDAIKEMRATIQRAILDSGLFEDLAGAVASIAETIKSEGFKNAFKDFIGTIKSFIDNFRNFGLGTALLGGTETVDTPSGPQTVEIKGLFENLFGEGGVISDAFASVTPQLTTMFTNILGSAFSAIGDGITSWFSDNWGKILIGALVGVGVLIAAPFVGLGAVIVAPVLAVFAGIAAYFGAAEIKEWIIDAWNSITGVFSGIGEWWSNLSFTDMISNAYETVTGVFSGIGEWWSNLSFTDMISNAWETVTGFFSFGDTSFSISGLISNAWETVTGFFSFGETSFSISGLISSAWETVTGFFSFGDSDFSISGLMSDAWTKVTDFFSFVDTSFSISQLATDAWTNVTNWFGLDGLDFSISALGTVAWEAVKSWFSFGTDTMFSIAQLGIDAWANVISWFGFGDGEGFSISQLATDAWATVTGFFSFGDGEGFSISQLATDAWATVTGFFSFGDFTFPSITSLFDGLWGKLTGFFDFDFKLPNFREFLPTWLGGSGKSLSDNENTIDPAAIENASSAGDALNQTQTALSTFAALPDLQNNLDILNRGLDIDGVRQYNRAMEQLVETLEDLNEVLAEDNTNMFGGGTGVAASDVLGQMNTASTGSSEGIDQLNRLMSQMLAVLQAMAEDSDNIERNTRSMGGNIANGRISAIR